MWIRERRKSRCASFYKPVGIPEGFYCLGHYSQSSNQPLRGFVLAARANKSRHNEDDDRPPLKKPMNYTLVWSSDSDCYFWLPNPPVAYRAVGVLVTEGSEEPEIEEVRCVREDLTESCEPADKILGVGSLNVWTTKPCERGIWSRSVAVGSFFCSTSDDKSVMNIACLKNVGMWSKPTVKRKTKIVCTIGPSTNTREMIWKLAEARMNVARMNMSHGDHASYKKVIDLVKEYNAQSKDNTIAIMLDTKGPEVRSGDLPQIIMLNTGQEFTFTIERGVLN